MRTTYADIVREDRRLAILQVLAEQSDGQLNSSTLDGWLRHIRTPGGRADTMQALHWLRDEGLLTLAPVEDVPTLHIATLSAAGLDVAEGRVIQPGVARPSLRG